MIESLVPRALTLVGSVMPKGRQKVVLHSLPDLEDGILSVLAELLDRGFAPIVLTESALSAAQRSLLPDGSVTVVAKNSPRGYLHYLTARVVITTHGVYRPHHPPRGQVVVNLWHGEPLTKPVGLFAGLPATRSTWATSLSRLGQGFRCAEFGLDPRQVLVVGSARNDRLLTAGGERVRAAAVGDSGAERVYIWLPTYREHARGVRTDGDPFAGMLPLADDEMRALDDWLGRNRAVLIAKPHPLSPLPEAGAFSNIRAIDGDWLSERGLGLYPLLAGCDGLITDISSVWIDYLLLDRPVLFHFPDLESYRTSRGIHLEPYEDWVPGPITASGDQLIAELEELVQGRDRFSGARARSLRQLHRHHDAHSTARLLDRVGLLGGATVRLTRPESRDLAAEG